VTSALSPGRREGRLSAEVARRLAVVVSALTPLTGLTPAEGVAQPPAAPVQGPLPLQPAARRVFAVDLDGDGSDEVLCAQGNTLTAYPITPQGALGEPRWVVHGEGEAHALTEGPLSTLAPLTPARALVVAWGQGVGQLSAPLTLTAIDPLSGASREIWRHAGPRSQAVSLALSRDTSGAPLLRVAHFVSKYHTREVTLTALPLTPSAPPATQRSSEQIRMGTSWVHADVNADGREDLVVGRVYGEDKGEYGDLLITLGRAGGEAPTEPLVAPTARGVKGVWWGRWGEGAGASLYFTDGWVAAYGARARAHLRRLRWREGRLTVESLLSLPGEYALFDIFERLDPSLPGASRLFAQGSAALYLLVPRSTGEWGAERLAELPPVVNAAVAYAQGAWWVVTPLTSGVTLRPLSLPPHHREVSP
jgi:hypothetical protein